MLYIYSTHKDIMSNTKGLQTPVNKTDHHDPLDSYFECINSCSWVGGEDIECVTRCIEVQLKYDMEQS